MECCKHAGKALHPGARRIAIRPAALHTRLLQAKAAQTDTIPVPDVDFQDTGPDEFSDGKAVLKNMTLAGAPPTPPAVFRAVLLCPITVHQYGQYLAL